MSNNSSTAAKCRRIPLTVNSVSLAPVDPDNVVSGSVDRENNTPVLVFGETVIFCLTFLDGAGSPCVFSANDSFELAIDADYIHGTDQLMAYSAGSSSVNVSGDWSEADPASGKISIRVNCNTVGFSEKMGSEESRTVHIEVKRTTSPGLVKSLLLKTDIEARNTIVTDETAPAETGREVYSAEEVDALLDDLEDDLETQIAAKTTEIRIQEYMSAHEVDAQNHLDLRSLIGGKASPSDVASAISEHNLAADPHSGKFDAAGAASAVMPAGTVVAYAGASVPSGFLPCDGGEYSRSTYSALFDAIGTTYGAGDGSITFNVPDLTGKFILGSTTVGTAATSSLSEVGGSFQISSLTMNFAIKC